MNERKSVFQPSGYAARQSGHRVGVTLVEMVVVVLLSSMVIGSASLMLSRSHTQYRRGAETIENQALLERVADRIRLEIRSMSRLISVDSNEIIFDAELKGKAVRISYRYDPDQQTLFREEISAGGIPVSQQDFRGLGKIQGLTFREVRSTDPAFPHALDRIDLVALFVSSDGRKGPPNRTIALGHLYSRCLEPENPFRRK
jgi:hypothetical protein